MSQYGCPQCGGPISFMRASFSPYICSTCRAENKRASQAETLDAVRRFEDRTFGLILSPLPAVLRPTLERILSNPRVRGLTKVIGGFGLAALIYLLLYGIGRLTGHWILPANSRLLRLAVGGLDDRLGRSRLRDRLRGPGRPIRPRRHPRQDRDLAGGVAPDRAVPPREHLDLPALLVAGPRRDQRNVTEAMGGRRKPATRLGDRLTLRNRRKGQASAAPEGEVGEYGRSSLEGDVHPRGRVHRPLQGRPVTWRLPVAAGLERPRGPGMVLPDAYFRPTIPR